MRHLYCGVLFLLLCQSFSVCGHDSRDSLLNALDQTIANQRSYVKEKNDRIHLLVDRLNSDKQLGHLEKYELYQLLYLEYRSFQYDSAFKYVARQINSAVRLADASKLAQAKLNLSFVLRSSGKFKETFDTLGTIHVLNLPQHLAIEYYEQMGRTYYDLSAYNNDEYYSHITGHLGDLYVDSAIRLCSVETLQYYRLKGLKAQANGNNAAAIAVFKAIIEKFDIDQHQYAMAAYSLGKINEALGNKDAYVEMVIRSAIADIKSSTKETLSTMELASYMYETGEIERASLYINQAAQDVEFYGAKQRISQVSSLLRIIEDANLTKAKYKGKRLLTFLVSLGIVSVLIVSFALILYRQYRKLRATKQNLVLAYEKLQDANDKLLEANTIKEEYIGYSFAKDSEYLEKLDKFKQDISTRLTEKKYESILYTLKLFNLEREKEGLYKKFDEIFLKLFPTFVTYFNSFFEPQNQFEIKANDPLPTELRIFALIRIGITEHEQIARILGYSVRTIYNYKNKVKGMANIPKDEFEAKLMKIKTFE